MKLSPPDTFSLPLAVAAGASAIYVHPIVHLQGDQKALDGMARAALGCLEQIRPAFGE